jgi:RNA-directed DNA polymerase
MIEFGGSLLGNRLARGQRKPETFAFMGFTHIFGRTRQGWRLMRRHTVSEGLNAELRQAKATLRRMRHLPIPEQGRYLRLVLNGFYNYSAGPTNSRALNPFYTTALLVAAACGNEAGGIGR